MESNNLVSKIKAYIDDKLYMGPTGIIGIDIGISAIKLAEVKLQGDETYKLHNYVSVTLPEGVIIEDEIQKEDELLEAISNGLKQLKSSNKFICFGMSGPNTMIKRLQLAAGSPDEVGDSVMWEAEQYLPFPADDGNISYSIIGENQGGGYDVIVGAARKSVIENFKVLIEKTNYKVKIVDHNATAFVNVFESVMPEMVKQKNKCFLLLDVGAQRTHFIIHKGGSMVFFKEISIGGITITEEVQRQMGVNYFEAESLKVFGDGNGNIPEEIVEIINQVIDSFLEELKKTIDFWMSSTSEETFDGCIVSGGASQTPGFVEALQEVLETEITVLNPFSSMTYNQKNINEEEVEDIAYRGVVAIGLAMRTVGK